MIRVLLLAAAFSTATVALLIIQPGPDPRTPIVPGDSNVTRTDVDFDRSETAARYAGADTSGPTDDMDALGFGLMDGLAPERGAKRPAKKTADGLLVNLDDAAAPRRSAGPVRPALEVMVIRALRNGQSEDYIDALVNHAASSGTVDVPRNLISVDGRVDTGALLAALGPEVSQHGPGGEYKVEAGDTLASIAYRFYGTTTMKDKIFDANKDRIVSPAHVSAGLMLVLPAQ